MTPDERAAAARLVGRAAAGLVDRVQSVHLAVAGQAPSTGSDPVKSSGGRAQRVYGTLRACLELAGTGVGAVLGAIAPASAPPLAASPRGAALQAMLNGAVGEELDTIAEPLAIRMAVRLDGRDVQPRHDALAAAFPEATARVVVFVHGLFGDETDWRGVYGDRLRDDLGWTPVYLRYSTGRGVDDNGADLSSLLESLHVAWPVPIERLVLVGHSMGGLVGRVACRVGADRGASWVPLLSDVVSVGTPHRGALLARVVAAADRGLRRLPATSALAVDVSPGLRDLEWGVDVEHLPTARHHVVGGIVEGARGLLLGDLLVDAISVRSCDHEDAVMVPASHSALLTHPAVSDALHQWLAAPSAPGR